MTARAEEGVYVLDPLQLGQRPIQGSQALTAACPSNGLYDDDSRRCHQDPQKKELHGRLRRFKMQCRIAGSDGSTRGRRHTGANIASAAQKAPNTNGPPTPPQTARVVENISSMRERLAVSASR